MELIDRLFNEVKDQHIPDDENIELVVANFLQGYTRNDLLRILDNLPDDELYALTSTYLVEELRKKVDNLED